MSIKVTKRNGSLEKLNLDKINKSAERACDGLSDVFPSEVVLDASLQLFDGISTADIDKALILSSRSKIEKEPNYSYVAAQLLLNSLYKEVFGVGVEKAKFHSQYRQAFKDNVKILVENHRLNENLLSFDLDVLADAIVIARDNNFKYLGLQTLYDRYFIHLNKRRMETPQSFFMRVAMGLAINEEDKNNKAIEFYNVMSKFLYMPSTPTLFNSGTCHPQLSSCYLSTVEDSIDGIFGTIKDQARLSKFAGGLGFDCTPLRGTGGWIKTTNGESCGLIPWLKIFNDMLVAVNQGGRRKGAGCTYCEVFHIDIEDFLEVRKDTGDDQRRCHDMNTAVWIPDYFMECVEGDMDWYLFSPDEAPDLHEVYEEEFYCRYCDYIGLATEGKIKNWKVVKAKDLWKKILTSLHETGHPWITFKDAANVCYTNKHVGVIHSSNLCTEILLHTIPTKYDDCGNKTEIGEVAVCNLGSVNLPAHVKNGTIDYALLKSTIRTAMRMLDNVIDICFYPIEEAKRANVKNRPVGLGNMGFADLLHVFGWAYDSDEAVKLANKLQEFISFHAIETSIDLAAERGSYPNYQGSEWSKGKFPFELFDARAKNKKETKQDWDGLRQKLEKNGIRNSNTQAIAPTATISYICGCSQSIEPDYSVLWVYSTLSGDFTMINEYFVNKAKALGLWCPELVDAIKKVDGDVSKLSLPSELKKEFKTAFDINYEYLILSAAARQRWIDMGQSLNIYNNVPSLKRLNDIYFFAWENKLKTTYYLRGVGASRVEKSTVEATPSACSIEAMKRGEVCESCT